MNYKRLIIITISIIIFTFLIYFVGLAFGTFFVAVTLLIQAIVFSVKKDSYFKFVEWVNPKAYKAYSERGTEFLEKTRKKNLVATWAIVGITFFNSILLFFTHNRHGEENTFHSISFLSFLIMIILLPICIIIPILLLDKFILKKIKSGTSFKSITNQEILIGIILGIGLVIIVLCLLSLFIAAFILKSGISIE